MRVSDCFVSLRDTTFSYTFTHAASTVGVTGKIKEKQQPTFTETPRTPKTPEYNACLLDAYEERAAILEYDAGLSRKEAELQAAQDVGMHPLEKMH